jgi:hypothetical protein
MAFRYSVGWRGGRRSHWLVPWLCLLVCGLVPSGRADEIPFTQETWEALPNHDIGQNGQAALSVRPAAWLHGECPHFIIHYRRITEAKTVALQIEFHLAFIAKTLGAAPDRYAQKSHVFIFEDDKDWKAFISQTNMPPWVASYAWGDELFLNVRNGTTGTFDAQTLAHETTHAVVARLYPHQRFPLWLSEGFAEEMSGRSVAARQGFNPRALQRFRLPALPLDQLTAMTVYPADVKDVAQLYQSAERLVHFLMAYQPERFPKLIDLLISGTDFATAVPAVYGDRYPTYAAFARQYALLPK